MPRRAALTLAGLLLGVPVQPPRAANAAPPPSVAAAFARLAAREPDAAIAVGLWTEAIKLGAASGELATPVGGTWCASRGDCLASLRLFEEAEPAYADATIILEAVGMSGAAAGSEAALRLAMAHDGRSLCLGAMGDWAGAAEASRQALAAAGLAGVAVGGGADVPTGAFNAGLRGGAPTAGPQLRVWTATTPGNLSYEL
jgi:hypothetical protein